VEPEQPIVMAQALRRVLEDSELAWQLGYEARATVVRDYRLSSVVEQCLELYRQLLAKSKKATPNDEASPEQNLLTSQASRRK